MIRSCRLFGRQMVLSMVIAGQSDLGRSLNRRLECRVQIDVVLGRVTKMLQKKNDVAFAQRPERPSFVWSFIGINE